MLGLRSKIWMRFTGKAKILRRWKVDKVWMEDEAAGRKDGVIVVHEHAVPCHLLSKNANK